jgi:hypothetical protein
MNPPEYLIRIEGVNLSAFVFDTRDLSTARGGSLMLLDAVDVAAQSLGDSAAPLSRGASMGLFKIATHDPKAIVDHVRKALASDRNLAHATFVVDVLPATGEFRNHVEGLISANRWRQMQASTLAIPPAATFTPETSTQPACNLDGLRPAGGETLRSKKISESAHSRREYGRNQKQAFYRKATEQPALAACFANDFESIAKRSKPLDGKIAVFYADGNGFGGIQANHCDGEQKQKKWDELVRGKRRDFLKSFLADEVGLKNGAAPAPGSPWHGIQRGDKPERDDFIRFETLLWGGDEFMFVMPAALGWRFAAFFFKEMQGIDFEKNRLSHAASLVFCQHHAPIHRIKHLAKDEMAEFAKCIKDGDRKIGRQRDSLVVVALESFDHLGTGFEAAMKLRYHNLQPPKNMILAGSPETPLHTKLAALADHLDALRSSELFPRSQLRGLVSEILAKEMPSLANFKEVVDEQGRPKKDENGKPIRIPPRQFRNASSEDRAHLLALLSLFGGDPLTLWLQLEELWDYARP